MSDLTRLTKNNEDLEALKTDIENLPDYQDLDHYEDIADEIISTSGYIELKSIHSTGTQYIDTGIKPALDTNFELIFKFTNYIVPSTEDDEHSMFFGAEDHSSPYDCFSMNVPNIRSSSLSNDCIFFWFEKPYAQVGDSGIRKLSDLPLTTKSILTYKNNQIIYNATTQSQLTRTEKSSYPYNIYLFANNYDGVPHIFGFGEMYVYSLRIWQGEILVRDFIPAKDFNNTVGLWDKVSSTFFYNQGTGNFVGEELSDG